MRPAYAVGSGWAWLVVDKGSLRITKTPTAVFKQDEALLINDVWEMAVHGLSEECPQVFERFLILGHWDFALWRTRNPLNC